MLIERTGTMLHIWSRSIYIYIYRWIIKQKSCLTLCHPMGYTDHGILQPRILDWVAFPFSRGSSQTRDWTQVSLIAGGFFSSSAMREAQMSNMTCLVGKLPLAAMRSCYACQGYLWGPLIWNWNWKRSKKMDTWALLVNNILSCKDLWLHSCYQRERIWQVNQFGVCLA